MLLRHPVMSSVTVVALALGIGFTAIMFSVVNTVLIRGLPFPDSGRIAAVTLPTSASESPFRSVPLRDYLDWRERLRSFEVLAAYREGSANLGGPEGPVRYSGAWVTASVFAALRAVPAHGRPFREDDGAPDAPPAVILSHHLWVEVFGRSRGTIGDSVTVNGEVAEIVGIMPEGFLFPWRQDLWMPLRMSPPADERDAGGELRVFGRLGPGVSAGDATAELTRIPEQAGTVAPGSRGAGEVVPFTRAPLAEGIVPLLWATLGAASLLLLTACANTANVLLLRASARVRETGIRTAMGAHPRLVAYRTMQEAAVLALLGAVLGTVIAWVGIGLFDRATAGMFPPFWIVLELDLAAFLFIVAAATLAAVLSGAPPAWQVTRADTAGFVRNPDESPQLRIGGLSRWMATAGLAMAMGLLVAAGLMTRSLVALSGFDYGFDHEGVFSARVWLAEADFPDAAGRQRFFAEVRERVAALPDVEFAAIGSSLPGAGSGRAEIAIEGEGSAEVHSGVAVASVTAWRARITPGYFAAFGVPVLRGRDFGPGDTADAPSVAIVNESFAAMHLGSDALGRRLRVDEPDGARPWSTVVGVVPDVYFEGLASAGSGPEGIYTPLAQGDAYSVRVIAAGRPDPLSLTAGVREAVTSVNPNTPIYQAEGMSGVLARATQFFRTSGFLLVVFGTAALLVAAVGLYGVVSFAAGRRRRELGVRIILGAGRPEIFRQVLRQGLVPTCSGLIIGAALALLIAWHLRSALFEVSPFDPWSFSAAAVMLLCIGLLAAAIPGLLATRIDPAEALRAK